MRRMRVNNSEAKPLLRGTLVEVARTWYRGPGEDEEHRTDPGERCGQRPPNWAAPTDDMRAKDSTTMKESDLQLTPTFRGKVV